MFGYIIQFCSENNFNLTIFADNLNNDNDWLTYYKNELFPNFEFDIKHYNFFQQEKYLFDINFLTSDTDKLYFEYFDTEYLKNNTICITHQINYLYKVQHPDSGKTIYVRPFELNLDNEWFLPCFSPFHIENADNSNKLQDDNFINIAIIGACVQRDINNHLMYYNYNTTIINRLKTDKKIRLHVIAKNVTSFQFFGLINPVELHTYENIQTEHMFNILNKCNFIITDVNCYYPTTREIDRFSDVNKHIIGKNVGHYAPEDYHFKYEKRTMSGAVPLAFSLCIPLIISKQTNQYYKFRNAIEFDKTTDEPILLNEIDSKLIEEERNELIDKFTLFANKYVDEIDKKLPYKMEHKRNYKIVYLNMDERNDRRIRFEKHMEKYDL
jgi:hypothetical protein